MTSSGIKPLVFLHIPKTGGTTLRALLAYHFRPAEIANVPDEDSLNSELVGRLIGSHKFIHGHINYACLEPLAEQIEFLCFLREPVSRVLSTYYFLREQDPHLAPSEEMRRTIESAVRLTLPDFLHSDDPVVNRAVRNLQCYSLTGENHTSDANLEKAKAVLSKARFVGIMERYPESLQLLGRVMGWPTVTTVPVLNASDRSKRVAKTDREAAALIAELNANDVKLYDFACQLFAEKLSSTDSSPRTWRQQVRYPERYRNLSSPLGQVTEMSRPILATGWHGVEGTNTNRPWRFAGFGPVSTVHSMVDPQEGTEIWALSYIPFFAPGVRPENIAMRVNGHPQKSNCLTLAQGVAFLTRTPNDQLESDGLQCFEFDSSQATVDQETLKNKLKDDRPIRFALSRILLMQFSSEDHPKFSKRLLQVIQGMANREAGNPYTVFLQQLALKAQKGRQFQPRTNPEVGWCSPLYQRNRLRLLEQLLPEETPTQTSLSMQQLYDADPALMAELLFFFYPHIEPRAP